MLTTGMTLKNGPQEFICHSTKAWSEETGQAHIKSACVTGDDVTSIKHILDAPKITASLEAMKL